MKVTFAIGDRIELTQIKSAIGRKVSDKKYGSQVLDFDGDRTAQIAMPISEGKVIHDGVKYPVYLYQIDEKIEIGKDFINHPNSTFEVGMEFRTKRELKLKLIDVINE